MGDVVYFEGCLYVKQACIANKGWITAGGLAKALTRLGIERLSPLRLGLSGAWGAGAGKYFAAARAVG